MSEAAIKMIGLAIMAVSVFLILFGLYLSVPPLAWFGTAFLLIGFILHVVVRKN